MANRSFDSLVPLLQPSVPGCPQPIIVQYIRDSAIRTCERTLLWRQQLPLFNLQPGVFEYLYNSPAHTEVHVLFEAHVNGFPLLKLTLEQALERYPSWADLFGGIDPEVVWGGSLTGGFNHSQLNTVQYNANTELVFPPEAMEAASNPRFITHLGPTKYIVLPLPDDEREYKVRMFVALKPKRSATGMDEDIFNELEDSIMHGALQHLLVLPNFSWSDRELASYHAKQYVFTTSERRARANLTNARGMLRVRLQPFGV